MATEKQPYSLVVHLTPTEFFHLVCQLDTPKIFSYFTQQGSYHYDVKYQGIKFQTCADNPLRVPAVKRPSQVTLVPVLINGFRSAMMPPIQT